MYHRVIELADLESNSSFPIHDAIRGNNPDLVKVVRNNRSTINDQDLTGETPLHLACRYNNNDAFNLLLQEGADIHVKHANGKPTLHFVCLLGDVPCAKALLRAGCDVNERAPDNRTALMEAVGGRQGSARLAMVRLLLQEGATASCVNKVGQSVLHKLDYDEDPEASQECFEALMEAGARSLIDCADHDGITPLFDSLLYENSVMTSLLIKAGARMDLQDSDGFNILHFAADYSTKQTLKILLGAQITGVDPRTLDKRSRTPLDRFRSHIHADSSDLLLGLRKPIESEIDLFEELLRDVRDRAIMAENAAIESVKYEIREGNTEKARKLLGNLVEAKRQAQIEWEVETFRAIELDIRNGSLDLAIESLDAFMEVSRARMDISPFEEEEDLWLSDDDSCGSYYTWEGSVVEILSDDENYQEDDNYGRSVVETISDDGDDRKDDDDA